MGQITDLLQRFGRGDGAALDELLPLVYEELRVRAQHYLRRERADHTLSPTGLVHETFLRLVDQRKIDWQDRSHFFAVSSRAMRRILVDHARRYLRRQRGAVESVLVCADGGIRQKVTLQEIVEIDEALTKFADNYSRPASVVELLFFGGLTQAEIATVLGVSVVTVKRDWRLARAWLSHELQAD